MSYNLNQINLQHYLNRCLFNRKKNLNRCCNKEPSNLIYMNHGQVVCIPITWIHIPYKTYNIYVPTIPKFKKVDSMFIFPENENQN